MSEPGESVEQFIARSREVALTALKGCPAQTYTQMSELLDKLSGSFSLFNENFPPAFGELVAQLLAAQQIDDLLCISDFLGFELPYVLEHCRR